MEFSLELKIFSSEFTLLEKSSVNVEMPPRSH